jgi:hypothetical protein
MLTERVAIGKRAGYRRGALFLELHAHPEVFAAMSIWIIQEFMLITS